MPDEKNKKIRTPANELDFNIRLIEPAWGKDEVSANFQEQLTREYFVYDGEGNLLYDEAGNPMTKKKLLWDMLGFITKDFREGNLQRGNIWKGIPDEVEYCQYWAELCKDFLAEGYDECAMLALGKVALKLELTLSAGGFFMRNINTFRQENKVEHSDKNVRSLFNRGGEIK